MIDIMIKISSYIFLAILLGYFFGWLVTKLLLKERYQNYLDEILLNNSRELEELNGSEEELSRYKKENKQLKTQNKELNFSYENQKYGLGTNNPMNDKVIESLTSKLSLMEEKQVALKQKHEEEIDAFIFERIEITQKYKSLLEEKSFSKEDENMKASWFSKFFSSSSPSIS